MAKQRTSTRRKTKPPELKAPFVTLPEPALRALPIGYDPQAYGFPEFLDPVVDVLDPDAYQRIAAMDETAQPLIKLGSILGSFRPRAQGKGEMAENVQIILDNIIGWTAMMEFSAWTLVEALRFYWLESYLYTDGDTGKQFLIPDLTDGGRRKTKAGGSIEWDGVDIVQRTKMSGTEMIESVTLPRARMMVFKRGVDGNPEGDSPLAYPLANLAREAETIKRALSLYIRRFAVPMLVLQKALGTARPNMVTNILQQSADTVSQEATTYAISVEDAMKLIEPTGTGGDILLRRLKEIEAAAHKLVLLNTLTSSTNESGPAGSSMTHQRAEDTAAEAAASSFILDALNRDLLPYILKTNYGKLGEGYVSRILLERIDARETTLDDMMQMYDAGLPVDSVQLYSLLGSAPPPGMPRFITKSITTTNTGTPSPETPDGNDSDDEE